MGKKDTEMVRVNIALPRTVKEAAAEYATRAECSMSQFMADAVEEGVRRSAQEELAQRLEEAYGEMSEQLSEEVAAWDHTSKEAWRRAFSDDERNGVTRK